MASVARFMANPYPFYRRLRSREPVHWDGSSWMLTRYADVVPALRDAHLSSRQFDHRSRLVGDEASGEVARHFSQWMLYSDPPNHTRLRALAQRAFTLEPDRFDITRQEARHIGFGYGAHYCLGAPLARLEGQLALQTMLRRFSTLQLASTTLDWHATVAFRGLRALPVTF